MGLKLMARARGKPLGDSVLSRDADGGGAQRRLAARKGDRGQGPRVKRGGGARRVWGAVVGGGLLDHDVSIRKSLGATERGAHPRAKISTRIM